MRSRPNYPPTAVSAGVALVLSLLVAGCDSGGSGPHSVSAPVGRAGGILTVPGGPLAGTSLVIPALSLTKTVNITIDGGSVLTQPDASAIGPGAAFGPSELQFRNAASAILVFNADEVPESTPDSEFVVKRRDSRGRITNLVPDLVKQSEGRLLVFLSKFSTYWVAVKRQPYWLADYWPLQNGDFYEYDNGVVLQLTQTTAEPQLSQPVIKATFVTATGESGLYLERSEFGETFCLGRFSVAGGFQELETVPLMLLPASAELGASGSSESSSSGYEPYGSMVPTFSVYEQMTTTLVSGGALNTPLGQYPDVIEIDIVSEREEVGSSGTWNSTVRDRLWLARGIGPVHIALQGLPVGQITGGVVGGRPVQGQ